VAVLRCRVSDEKPVLRKAQVITEEHGDAAMASQDPERMRLALIDGSRCLPGEWALRHAPKLIEHEHAGVRWAALFALDFVRSEWLATDRAEISELLHAVEAIASGDPDESVRHMAATVLGDVARNLLHRLPSSVDRTAN